MKKLVMILSILFLVGFVSSMSGPIKVMTQQGNRVSVIIRNTDKMTLNNDRGVVDSDGVFVSDTFFSLSVPYNLRVVITKVNGDFVDFIEDVTDSVFDVGIDLDCRSGSCVLSASEVIENVSEEVVEEIVEEDAVIFNESDVVVIEEGVEDSADEDEILITGKALLFKEDGSFNFAVLGGGVFVLLLFCFFVVMMVKRGGSKKRVLDDEERELEDVERKVYDTEEKIKRVREGKDRRNRIYKAKLKLAEEERELAELVESGRSSEGRVESQRQDVREARENVDKVEGDGGV